MSRLAAIDVGTNSVRSIIVDIDEQGGYQLVDDEKEYTRLGQGMGDDLLLADEAVDRTIEALRRMDSVATHFGVTETRAIATSAVRRAANGPAFVARVKSELGLDVTVVSEEDEGRLAFLSAAAAFSLKGRSGIVDIGGGSVEIVRSAGAEIESIFSLPIGAVTLTERFVRKDPLSEPAFDKMRKHVRKSLDQVFADDRVPVTMLVGSGGSVNAMAAMIAAERGMPPEPLQGFELAAPDVARVLARLKHSTAEERLAIPGLPPQRVDIIVAGAVLVAETMRAFGAGEMFLNTKGIREGLVLDVIARRRGRATTLDRMGAVVAFAERCGYEPAHAGHVRDLALSLFDQLEAAFGLPADARELLEAAAILHDVGYLVAYDQHPSHSYHLITYSGLPGFRARELHIVAAVARYHGNARPKTGQQPLQGLTKADRRLVKELSAVLKVADGLDRTRVQHVTAVRVDATGKNLVMTVQGPGDLSLDIRRAAEKGELLGEVFGRKLEIVQAV